MSLAAKIHRCRPLLAVLLAITALLGLAACGSGKTGNNSNAPTWNYTALGDSLAAGLIAQQGYVDRYASYVNMDTGSNVVTLNLGVPGWTTSDLLNSVQNDSIVRSQVQNAQIVTFDIGGNDLADAHNKYTNNTCGGTDNQDCLRSAITTFEQNWDAIVAALLQLRSTSNTIIRTMDIYDPYVAADMRAGINDLMQGYLKQANDHIHSSGQANNIAVANVFQAFNGSNGQQDPATQGLLAIDGFHPNDTGHKVIADQLRALGYAPLK